MPTRLSKHIKTLESEKDALEVKIQELKQLQYMEQKSKHFNQIRQKLLKNPHRSWENFFLTGETGCAARPQEMTCVVCNKTTVETRIFRVGVRGSGLDRPPEPEIHVNCIPENVLRDYRNQID